MSLFPSIHLFSVIVFIVSLTGITTGRHLCFPNMHLQVKTNIDKDLKLKTSTATNK